MITLVSKAPVYSIADPNHSPDTIVPGFSVIISSNKYYTTIRLDIHPVDEETEGNSVLYELLKTHLRH